MLRPLTILRLSLFSFILSMCLPLAAANKNIVIDDIKFSINTETKVAQVKGRVTEATKKWKLVVPSTLLTDWGTIKVTSIGADSFYYDEYLTSVTLSDYTETIGSNAFLGCHNLTSVSLGSKLTIVGYRAFSNSGLKEVTFPASLQIIRQEAFYHSSALKRVIFESGSKKLESIGKSAFAQTGLTSVTLPGCVKEIGERAFWCCESMESVTLLGGNGKTVVGEDAFSNNDLLSTLNLGNPGIETIMDGAFCGNCLEKVILPASVRTIGVGAFWSNNIQFLKISEGVTTIGERAFSDQISKGSDGMAAIDIPASVKSIGKEAFTFSGRNLQEVICRATVPPSAPEQAFDSNTLTSTPLSVVIPSVEAYKTAPTWKDFNVIKGIGQPIPTDIVETESDEENKETRWMDLHGVEIPHSPTLPGLYIRISGGVTEKIYIPTHLSR